MRLSVSLLFPRLLSTNNLLNSLSADISPIQDFFKSSSTRVERLNLLDVTLRRRDWSREKADPVSVVSTAADGSVLQSGLLSNTGR